MRKRSLIIVPKNKYYYIDYILRNHNYVKTLSNTIMLIGDEYLKEGSYMIYSSYFLDFPHFMS